MRSAAAVPRPPRCNAPRNAGTTFLRPPSRASLSIDSAGIRYSRIRHLVRLRVTVLDAARVVLDRPSVKSLPRYTRRPTSRVFLPLRLVARACRRILSIHPRVARVGRISSLSLSVRSPARSRGSPKPLFGRSCYFFLAAPLANNPSCAGKRSTNPSHAVRRTPRTKRAPADSYRAGVESAGEGRRLGRWDIES